MSVKTYRKYPCAYCNRTAKTERVFEGLKFGNPLYKCQHCGLTNYDKFILEPALLDPQLLIEDGKQSYNTLLLILYFPFGIFAFLALSLVFNSFIVGFAIVCIPLCALTALILQKRKNVTLEKYSEEINASIARLEANVQYANLVIKCQGVHPQSVWYTQNNSQ